VLVVIILAESILLLCKIKIAASEIGFRRAEWKGNLKDIKFYIACLGCLGVIFLAYWISGKDLAVLQFIDILISYLILSIVDIKTLCIPDKILLLTGCSQLIYGIFLLSAREWIRSVVAGLIVYAVFLLISVLSKGGLGIGDVKLLGLTTIFTNLFYLLQVIFLALLLTFFYSVILLILKKCDRKTELPFAPFLLGGMLIHMSFWI